MNRETAVLKALTQLEESRKTIHGQLGCIDVMIELLQAELARLKPNKTESETHGQ
jgi:hypothetical protein